MTRPRSYASYIRTAKEEALLSCDLYNQRRRARNLEAFIVHMVIAWLNLFLAICFRDGIDCYYRQGRRIQRVDGEPKTWELTRCLQHFQPNADDPVRSNLEFFIRLRNKIEHRFSEKQRRHLEAVVAAKSQAMILNFEKKLVDEFGESQSLGDYLRFPIFLSSITQDGLKAVKSIYAQLPAGLRLFIEAYDDAQNDAVRQSEAYEFRIYLIPKVSSRAQADLAVEFVDLSRVPPEKGESVEKAQVIIRDRNVPIANANMFKSLEVVEQIQSVFPGFRMHMHVLAWKHFDVRPPTKARDPARTDKTYCVYDRAHRDYLYTEAWVTKLRTALAVDPVNMIKNWCCKS